MPIESSPVRGVITAADFMPPTELLVYAQRLESLGYPELWITDMFGREIYVTAGFILANTSRIKVATGIAHIYGRDSIASEQAGRTLSEFRRPFHSGARRLAPDRCDDAWCAVGGSRREDPRLHQSHAW